MNSIGLFDFPIGMPLAARMRPLNLDEIRGQEHIKSGFGPLLAYQNKSQNLPSLLVYGPPGTGKTTLARILADLSGRRLIEISAINASISDLRAAYEQSTLDISAGKSSAVAFIDEIHRFSKVQQESLLKAVEEGLIVLIGATTENPLFALTPAINSRAMLVTLEPLETSALVQILNHALQDERGLDSKFSADLDVLEVIARLSGGDGRKALTILETASVTAGRNNSGVITVADVEANIQTALARYDSTGDQHYDIISAFIKSVRGSDPDAALHYLARMLVGVEDPKFIVRRLVILSAEDVGLADPNALNLASSTLNIVEGIGMPEARIPLAELTIYLALAPKSNSAYSAIDAAISDVHNGFTPDIPLYLRSSSPTKGIEAYEYPHDLEALLSRQDYLPTRKKAYYQPKSSGFEINLADRFMKILGFRKKQ